ncbi:hypothetical protein HNQ51_000026 [Inhella inkyongensis]|uniref:Uncharacterized protein n=1 Tax=Inhella inkyongensis TaxID=392593 RepID=A0A840RYV6_9BURK|nr:hypothetical protein [Inhella inkyongensis]MBB5202731.1 hypothetical protein [Inhella inkyongensis]MBB5202732.1 hypothetical protein [Inhella inkyongensis]MBB5202733.1 hypothetical protein [Inhella inkyongensis]
MNTTKTLPARFNLASTGLSDAQLKGIAGARPGEKSPRVTVADVTVCCWG